MGSRSSDSSARDSRRATQLWLSITLCGMLVCTVLKIGLSEDPKGDSDSRSVSENGLMQPQSVMPVQGFVQPRSTVKVRVVKENQPAGKPGRTAARHGRSVSESGLMQPQSFMPVQMPVQPQGMAGIEVSQKEKFAGEPNGSDEFNRRSTPDRGLMQPQSVMLLHRLPQPQGVVRVVRNDQFERATHGATHPDDGPVFAGGLMQPQSVMQLHRLPDPESVMQPYGLPQPDSEIRVAQNEQSGAPPESPGTDAIPEDEKLGSPPEDNRLLFLRQATVLLSPGQMQFDYGVDYRRYETTYPVVLSHPDPDPDVLTTERVLLRRLVIPFAIRYGLTERTQLFADFPVGWARSERLNVEEDSSDNAFDMGDVVVGFSYLLRKGQGVRPDIVGTLAVVAPTGEHPYHPGPDVASLGNGFWVVSADLLFVRQYDPAVIFYGLGYKHYFSREYFGGEMAPGEEITYNFGVGFALNDSLTLSAVLLGSYQTETDFNGVELPDTDLEPLSLRFALTAVTARRRIIEPFVRFGLTSDESDANVGVVVTR